VNLPECIAKGAFGHRGGAAEVVHMQLFAAIGTKKLFDTAHDLPIALPVLRPHG
jgi:hypothetical protein